MGNESQSQDEGENQLFHRSTVRSDSGTIGTCRAFSAVNIEAPNLEVLSSSGILDRGRRIYSGIFSLQIYCILCDYP